MERRSRTWRWNNGVTDTELTPARPLPPSLRTDGSGTCGRRACASDRARVALDLGAVHDSSAVRIKCVASVHGTAVVPQHEVADAPDVLPGELRARDELPQLVEQHFGFRERKPDDIGVAPAAEIEH